MIAHSNEQITRDEIKRDISNAEDHAMALSLMIRYARLHSKDSMFLSEIQKNASDYKAEAELVFGFIEDSLKDLSEKMSHSYQRLDNFDMV